MTILSLAELRAREKEVRRSLATLFALRSIVSRPRSAQWRFLAAACDRLFSPEACEFDGTPSERAAQLKFEVQEKLRRFYGRKDRRQGLVLALVHLRHLQDYGLGPDHYPHLAGYTVVVRDGTQEAGPRQDLVPYLERVVTEALHAQFHAYQSLPELDGDALRRWFDESGPAYRAILRTLGGAACVISNALNPSTRRLQSIRVRRLDGSRATVDTREYWYLRWWDPAQSEYLGEHRMTVDQTYLLRRVGDGWRVHGMAAAPPRPPGRVRARGKARRPRSRSKPRG